ncbi:patatin-like phospholipase family protein [Emcibacter sp. SYSU 3D8]|uniref:patatin-like phospholipase family protein n=1 Tax=Emcibacter sp. SYSU 3D8 TaxID=3133969 RepID=UPI0031FE66EB
MKSTVRRLAILAVALCVVACASRPEDTADDLTLALSAKVATNTPDGEPLPVPRHEAPEAVPGRHQQILLLSGGGSHGAFGAGVLVGWTESGARPEFDIVTGVSTGALMATFAFLGTEFDGQLRELFTTVDNEQIYRDRGVSGLLKGSAFDQKPLEKALERTINDSVIERVAREHARGRRLFVATTNLDTGVPVMWDMGKIAASKSPGKAALYRKILLASAAIPGIFKPVYIKSRTETPSLHVDGTIRSSLLFHSFMLARDGGQDVWTIVNGKIDYARRDGPTDANITSLVPRAVIEMMKSNTSDSVYRAYVRTRQAKASFHLAYLPDDAPDTNPIKFVPMEMGALFQTGREMGRLQRWAHEPPRLESLERLP